MRKLTYSPMMILIGVAWTAGCGTSTVPTVATPKLDVSKFLLADEPSGALSVVELREQAKNDDDVVLVGRIGGAAKPWVAGRAAFSVVDPSLQLCDEGGGVCSCCKDKVCDAMALVKVVDEHGRVLKADARKLLRVKENELVVVSGKAKRDDAGNLTILARGVYVRR